MRVSDQHGWCPITHPTFGREVSCAAGRRWCTSVQVSALHTRRGAVMIAVRSCGFVHVERSSRPDRRGCRGTLKVGTMMGPVQHGSGTRGGQRGLTGQRRVGPGQRPPARPTTTPPRSSSCSPTPGSSATSGSGSSLPPGGWPVRCRRGWPICRRVSGRSGWPRSVTRWVGWWSGGE
jgi:hypothetical protein